MSDLATFSAENAAALCGVSLRQLRYWDDEGVFPASYRGPQGRFYTFRDILGLRTLGVLRNQYKLSLQYLKDAGEKLREFHDTPWASLTLFLVGKTVVFKDPSTGHEFSTRPTNQRVIPIDLRAIADDVRRKVEEMRTRRRETVGKVEKTRRLQRNEAVVAGTRIPTAAVWDFHKAGYSVAQIIGQYPSLTEDDVRAAIEYERPRRKSRKAS